MHHLIRNILFLIIVSFQLLIAQKVDYRRYSDKAPIRPKPDINPIGNNIANNLKWTKINPTVPYVDYTGVHFLNKDTGWACGASGTIIKTIDGATSWKTALTPSTETLLKIRSYNYNVVIAVGYNGLLLRSTDGGNVFNQVTIDITGDIWGLQMINDSVGWACGTKNSLIKTTDGGVSWKVFSIPEYMSNFWSLEFMNENYGFIAGEGGKIFKTIDGGKNWSIIQLKNQNPFYCVSIFDSLHISAGGPGANIVYSSDAGISWSMADTNLTHSPVNSIKYVSVDTGYILISYAGLLKTTNRGFTWTGSGDAGEMEMSLILKDRVGFSVDAQMKIMKSVGDFNNYIPVVIGDDLQGISFINDSTGWIVSDYHNSYNAGVYKTTNGGRNFLKIKNVTGASSVCFLDSLTGFLGEANYNSINHLLKTTDGGNSWRNVNIPDSLLAITKFYFVNNLTGWAIGGAVYPHFVAKTTDGGENWFPQLSAYTYSLGSGIFFIDSLKGWILFEGDYPYKTTDGGENWTRQINFNYEANDIIFTDSLNGFICGGSKLLKTSNGGNNWMVVNMPFASFYKFAKISSSHLLVTTLGSVFETTDSGNSWNLIPELQGTSLAHFSSPIKGKGYLAGFRGSVYKFEDTVTVNVVENRFNLPLSCKLYQNYPNPFNPETKIKFSTNKQSFIKLEIFDILGKKISTLLNEDKDTGVYEITWNAENLPSGIYFYRLQTEGFSEAHKMILIK